MEEVTLKVKFQIGDRVEFDNKMGKDIGLVSSWIVKPGLTILYDVIWSDKKESAHYDFELKTIL